MDRSKYTEEELLMYDDLIVQAIEYGWPINEDKMIEWCVRSNIAYHDKIMDNEISWEQKLKIFESEQRNIIKYDKYIVDKNTGEIIVEYDENGMIIKKAKHMPKVKKDRGGKQQLEIGW